MTSSASNASSRRRTLLWFLAIYVLALSVRLVYLWQVGDNPLYEWLTLDEKTNHHVAVAHLEGTAPPKAYLKAPLYLWYLMGVYHAFGREPDIARLLQVFVAALWAPLTFLIAQALFGRPTDVVAGLLGTLFWTFVFFSVELLDVAIGGAFYLLTVVLLVRVPDDHRWKWLLCGIAMGLGAITRPNILAVAPLLAITVVGTTWRDLRGLRRVWVLPAAKRVLGLALGCCLVVLPVTIRNRVVGGEWVLIGAYGGVNFYLANNVEADAKNVELFGLPNYEPSGVFDANDPYNVHCFTYRSGCDFTSQKLGRPCTRGEMNEEMFRLGARYIRNHPDKFITDSLKRLCWFFNAYEFADNKDLYQFREFSSLLAGLSWFHYGVLCPFILLGFALAVAGAVRSNHLVYYWVTLLGLIVPGMFFLVNARFRVAIVCMLAPLGAYGLVRTVQWCRPRVQRRKAFFAAAFLSGAAVFSNANLFGYRPHCHPYLMFIYAAACGATGRGEEMAEMIERIETSMAMQVEGGGRHGHALFCLYDYFDRNGPLSKAVHYAQRLIETRRLDAHAAPRAFRTLMKADSRTAARNLLALLNQGALPADPSFVAEALLEFAREYEDRQALLEARRCFKQLVARYPAELKYHERLEEIRSLLAAERFSTTSPSDRAAARKGQS